MSPRSVMQLLLRLDAAHRRSGPNVFEGRPSIFGESADTIRALLARVAALEARPTPNHIPEDAMSNDEARIAHQAEFVAARRGAEFPTQEDRFVAIAEIQEQADRRSAPAVRITAITLRQEAAKRVGGAYLHHAPVRYLMRELADRMESLAKHGSGYVEHYANSDAEKPSIDHEAGETVIHWFALLRAVQAFDQANTSNLPLPLLSEIDRAIAAVRTTSD